MTTKRQQGSQGRVRRHSKGGSSGVWNVPECVPLEPSAGPMTIGRTAQADIFLHSPRHPSMLSRIHASLWFNQSTKQWNITDLESLNGVYINGKTRIKPSTPVPLTNGTEICFGTLVPRNELRYLLTTSDKEPAMLLRVRGRDKLPGGSCETGTEAELSPQPEREVAHTSSSSPQENSGGTTNSVLESSLEVPPSKKPRVKGDGEEPSSHLRRRTRSSKKLDPNETACSSQDTEPSSSCPQVYKRDRPTKGDSWPTTRSSRPPHTDPLPLSLATPSQLVSPLLNLQTPASAIDELFSDGGTERDFDEIVSDAIFGEDGSLLPCSDPSSSEGCATSRGRGAVDGASLQVQAARDDMQREKQKLLSSIEALKSELASKEKLLVEKSEVEEGRRRKGGEVGVIDSMQEEFTCAICQELFVEAHTLSCAHSFCKKCIGEWMRSKRECPVCRKAVSTNPVHSLVLDNAIDRMVEKMGPAAQEERKKLKESRAPSTVSSQSHAGGSTSGPGGMGGGGHTTSGGGNHSGTNGSSNRQGGSGHSGASQHGGSGGASGRGGGRGSHHYVSYESHFGYHDDDYDEEDEDEYDSDSDCSDSSYVSGLSEAYYGGYGRCFNCGAYGHWANGCPYD